jgi:ABC-type branched-subunit amino acid transport system ATPase component/predicted MFS family arabinose efflux permease
VTSSLRQRWTNLLAALDPIGLTPLLVLLGLASVQSFDLTAFGVLSPDIRHTFHLSNSGIDTVAGLTGALPIVFAIGIGYLGDRYNRLRLSSIAGLVWGATAILTGLAPVLAILIIARIVGGIGYLSAETVYPSLLSDYYRPDGLGEVFTGYRFGAQGIGLLGAPLAGFIATLVGWRPTFVVLALPTFALVACLGLMREPARGASLGLSMTQHASASLAEGFRRVRAIRTLRRTWASSFLFGAGTISFATVANNFFKDVYHLGDTARGGASALLGVGGLIGIALGGWMTSKAVIGRRPDRLPTISGMLIVSFGALSLVLAAVPSLALALILAVFVTVGAFGFLPSYTTMVSLVAPPTLRSQAYAWSLLFYALGAVVITPIIGGIGDSNGQRVSLAVLGVIVAAGGLVGASASRFVAKDIESARRAEEAVGTDCLLSCRGVDASYDGVQVLFGVDFDLHAGEMVALLGTNGAGKSTFLKTITGLLDPVGGVIHFDGADITHSDPQASARAGIVQMPGGRGVFPTLTVAENLRMAGWLWRKDKRYVDHAIALAIEHFPILGERSQTPAGSLSGGEQQMLSLAQAFIAQPKLLLIDELSLGLAPTIVNRLVEIVRAIHQSGTTVVIVEQSVNTALRLADRAVFMEKGEVRFSGPTADLLDRPDILRAVFLQGAGAVEGVDRGDGASMDNASRPSIRNISLQSGVAEETAAIDAEWDRPGVALQTFGLTKSYGGIVAVNDVDVSVQPGEILGFIGANGAGKTTLFDLISGFAKADRGQVRLGGLDVSGWGPHRRAAAGLGRSFQDARLWPALTVGESLALALHEEAEITGAFPALLGPPRLADSEARLRAQVEDLIELMGLGAFRDKFVSELSTGSRRMVELAAIVGRRPKVLLFDEPSSGIAQRETEALGPLIHRIRDELACSVLIIEHDVPLLRSVADRMVALELGAVIATGTPAEVLEDPRVVESYLGAPVAVGAPQAAQEPADPTVELPVTSLSGAGRPSAGRNGSRTSSASNGTSSRNGSRARKSTAATAEEAAANGTRNGTSARKPAPRTRSRSKGEDPGGA